MQEQTQKAFDIVVLGATGVTGRLVAACLAASAPPDLRWGIAGRDAKRLAAVGESLGPEVPVVVVDLDDRTALARLAASTRVVLNLAGPYTPTAERVVEACVVAGTDYADLSGEITLLAQVIRRFDDRARARGIRIVQMAGWEALPADLTTMRAARAAVGEASGDGPGAGGEVRDVRVTAHFVRRPAQRTGTSSVSGGTIASILTILGDRDTGGIGDGGALLPPGSVGPGRFWSSLRIDDGRVVGPLVPVVFLDPPVMHRTAALLARERGEPYRPAHIREGNDLGPAGFDVRTLGRLAAGLSQVGAQNAAVGLARLPRPLRIGLVGLGRRVLPAPGSGPTGAALTDWTWEVTALATTGDGRTGTATLSGTGHPGYTATAAMIADLGLVLASGPGARAGCLTPALALGTEHRFVAGDLALS